MNAAQKLKVLGGIAWNLAQWLELRRWGRANNDTIVTSKAEYWIADCRQRAARIRAL